MTTTITQARHLRQIARATGLDAYADALYRAADLIDQLELQIENASAAEREACAQVAEGFPQTRDWVPGSLYGTIRSEIAEAIRGRGAA